MKAHLTVFALSAIMIASIGMAPAFGQLVPEPITVSTDKPSYSEGETITVTGQVRDVLPGNEVSVLVKSPNGNLVRTEQLAVSDDKTFSVNIIAAGALMNVEGIYTIEVKYGDRNSSTTFEYGGSTIAVVPPAVITSEVTDTTVLVEGATDVITYEITGGKLLNITPELPDTLIISIEATDDGELKLTIPKTVFDVVDDEVIVLVDNEEQDDYIEEVTETHRVYEIAFPAGTEEITLIGTFVVPEFGAIAAMILAVAIISIIAISAKSKLSIVPRY